MKHTLKADGAAFTPDGDRVNSSSAAGDGSALCACGWASESLPTRAARITAHRAHKLHPGEFVRDESVDDLPDLDGNPVPSAEAVDEELTAAGYVSDGEPVPDIPVYDPETGDIQTAVDVTEGEYAFTNSIYAADLADMGVMLATVHRMTAQRVRIKEQQRAHKTVVWGQEEDVRWFTGEFLPLAKTELQEALHTWQKENRKVLKDMPRNDAHRANRKFISDWSIAQVDSIKRNTPNHD